MNRSFLRAALLAALPGILSWAQLPAAAPSSARQTTAPVRRSGGTVTGAVKDTTGGIIPKALVTLTDQNGTTQTVSTADDGTFRFRGVAPGTYTIAAAFQGLQQTGVLLVSVKPGQIANANITMAVGEQKQQLTVTESANEVSVDPANNATATTLTGEDLSALPDDPDDLQADLQALAGPSAGPGGNQVYIDGFSGGTLPPKETIREIRINSNPFSAEFDRLGYGRIQIFTKPGSDKFHGQANYTISDGVWNSRNPFLTVDPPFRTQRFGGNVSGPISKTASFFFDVDRRNIDDNGIINATTLNTALDPVRTQSFFPTPQRRTTVSPRVDWQLGQNNTLSFRYRYEANNKTPTGVGAFYLPGSGYNSYDTEHSGQVVDTMVLGAHAINETRFMFDREAQSYQSQSNAPQIDVANSFVTGGSTYGSSFDVQNYYELQNYTTITRGAHTTKFGVRIRTSQVNDYSNKNFNGIYAFLGGTGSIVGADGSLIPDQRQTSIQQYQLTQFLLQQGASQEQILANGGGPSRFTITQGNPSMKFYQLDFGPFVQDDWKVKPNLTLSLGLRWESQTNIADTSDWAPRVGFAWSPGSGGNGHGKTVIRGGFGMFYDRFKATNVLNAYRFNGQNQIPYIVTNSPSLLLQYYLAGTAPPTADLTVDPRFNSRYQIDSHLQSPYLMQTVIGVEHQLFKRTTVTVNYMNARGNHELLTRDINAPYPVSLPGNFLPSPFGNIGPIYNYESTGIFRQNQLMVGINAQQGRRLSLFGRYVYGYSNSDTDGLSTVPSNQYNLAQDYGRSALDYRHSLFLGGSVAAKWGLRFSPFIVAHTGIPFNITTGTDLYETGSLSPTARPALVSGQDAAAGPGGLILSTPLGYLNTVPLPGQSIIERNAISGPGYVGINLRVSRTWGFGTTKFAGPSGGARAGGGGHGGFRGGGMDATSEHRYNVTVSVSARNILNHENLNTPNGSVTSPYFLQSTGITGGYGAEATASNQRRIDLQVRFAF